MTTMTYHSHFVIECSVCPDAATFCWLAARPVGCRGGARRRYACDEHVHLSPDGTELLEVVHDPWTPNAA